MRLIFPRNKAIIRSIIFFLFFALFSLSIFSSKAFATKCYDPYPAMTCQQTLDQINASYGTSYTCGPSSEYLKYYDKYGTHCTPWDDPNAACTVGCNAGYTCDARYCKPACWKCLSSYYLPYKNDGICRSDCGETSNTSSQCYEPACGAILTKTPTKTPTPIPTIAPTKTPTPTYYPRTITIQGHHVNSSGADSVLAGQGVQIGGGSINSSTPTWYFNTLSPAPSYSATATPIAGYNIYYSLCLNCTSHTTYTLGNIVSGINVSIAGSYADIYFKYVPISGPSPTPTSNPITTISPSVCSPTCNPSVCLSTCTKNLNDVIQVTVAATDNSGIAELWLATGGKQPNRLYQAPAPYNCYGAKSCSHTWSIVLNWSGGSPPDANPDDWFFYGISKNTGGAWGNWATIGMNVLPAPIPTPPIPISNPSNITSNSAYVSWSGTLPAGGYYALYYSRVNGDWSGLNTGTNNYITLTNLSPNATYQWYVQACNLNGDCSTSAAWSFFTTPAAAIPTPPPTPCQVTTFSSSQNLNIGGKVEVTASVTSGLGSAMINQMRFGVYDTTTAIVNPTSDSISPYSTVVTGTTGGNTAVWATADLSDGRVCQSTGTTDTDITVTGQRTTATSVNGALCASFSTDQGEISCEEAKGIALKKYPGQLLSVDKTIRNYESGTPPKTQTKEAKIWIINIRPDDQSIFPSVPKNTESVKFQTTDTIGVAVDRTTKAILFFEPVFNK